MNGERRLLGNSDKAAVLGIFGLAFCLRLVVAFQARGCPWFDVPVVDPYEYDIWAGEIARGTFLWKRLHIHGPLYPYFLALIYKLGGIYKYYLVRLAQFSLGSVNAVLIYFLARKVTVRSGALIAGLAAAFYWTFIHFDYHLFPTTLVSFLNLLLLLSLFTNQERPAPRGWFFSGLIVGLSGLGRPNALLLAPFLLVWMLLLARNWKRGSGWILVFLAGVVLIVAPVTWRNYLVARDFVLVQGNTGLNLYIGNNPDADGTPNVRPGAEWRGLENLPLKEEGLLRPSERNRFFISRVLQFMKGRPGKFLLLQFKKLLLFWNHYEITASMSPYFFVRFSPLLRFLSRILNFRIIGPLSLLGIFLLAGSRTRAAPLYLVTLVYLGVVVLTVVSSRYRTPVMPALLVFSAYSLVWGGEKIKQRSFRPVGVAVLALIPFFLLVNASFYRPDSRLEAEEYYNLGFAYLQKKDYPAAKEAYLEAVKIDPGSARAYNGLGITSLAFGREGEAATSFRKAIELDPGFADSYNNLGNIYRKQGNREEAASLYQKAIEVAPAEATAYNNLGIVYENLGRNEEAANLFRKAAEINPALPEAYFNLGVAYGRLGRTQEAIASYQEALKINPGFADAYFNLGVLLQDRGREEEAIELFRKTLGVDPDYAPAHNNLAVVYYYERKYDLAVQHCDRAIELGYPVKPELLEMLKPHRK